MSGAGTAEAMVTAELKKPIYDPQQRSDPKNKGYVWQWNFDLEIVCRIDSATNQPVAPELEWAPGWTTFLMPQEQGTFYDDIVAGFSPPSPDPTRDPNAVAPESGTLGRAVQTQDNLAKVFAPGPQVDPNTKSGPFADQAGRMFDHRGPAVALDAKPPGDYNWPPIPAVKVTFMPTGNCWAKRKAGSSPQCTTDADVDDIYYAAHADGWNIDHGGTYGKHVRLDKTLTNTPLKASKTHTHEVCCNDDGNNCKADAAFLGTMSFDTCLHKCGITTDCDAIQFGLGDPCQAYDNYKPEGLGNARGTVCRLQDGSGNWMPPRGCVRAQTPGIHTALPGGEIGKQTACTWTRMESQALCDDTRCDDVVIQSCEASSEFPDVGTRSYNCEQAYDGTAESWSSKSEKDKAWAKFSLGKTTSLLRMEFMHRSNGRLSTKQIKLEFSDGSAQTFDSQKGLVSFDLTPVSTSFVKVSFVGHVGTDPNIGIQHIAFRGLKSGKQSNVDDATPADHVVGQCSIVKSGCTKTKAARGMQVFAAAAEDGAKRETINYGWSCTPPMNWFGHGHGNVEGYNMDPWGMGVTQLVGQYYDKATRTSHATCPDGKLNEFELDVENGMYALTVGLGDYNAQPSFAGCVFENIRTIGKDVGSMAPSILGDMGGHKRNTLTTTIEITDGRFTMGSSPDAGVCGNVVFVKLDLITKKAYPTPWLPAPKHEWWQMELKADADGTQPTVGLVSITVPHSAGTTTASFPHPEYYYAQDCRNSWLYKPAKCFKEMQIGLKVGPRARPPLALFRFVAYRVLRAACLFPCHPCVECATDTPFGAARRGTSQHDHSPRPQRASRDGG